MSNTQEGPRRPPPGEPATYRDGKLETGLNREVASSSLPKNEAASAELQKAISPSKKEGKVPEGVSSKSDTQNIKNSEVKDVPGKKPETDYDKQVNEIKTQREKIEKEASKLQGDLKTLDLKAQQLEKEGKENSERARKAIDEIAKSAEKGPQNLHTEALGDLLKTLPDKLTQKDVQDYIDFARWDAAKASVGGKEWGNMNQAEKDLAIERVNNKKESSTPDPTSKLWGDAKKTIGLSSDTKWEDMSPAARRVVQARVAESQTNPVSSVPATNAPLAAPSAPSPAGPSKTVDSTFPQPQGTVERLVDQQQTLEEFAKINNTTVEEVNTNNGLKLTGNTVIAKGSEFYVPEKPSATSDSKDAKNKTPPAQPAPSPAPEKSTTSSSYSFLKEGIKTENEAGWDKVSRGDTNAFVKGDKLVYTGNSQHGLDKPWMNFEVSPTGALKYISYNKAMFVEDPDEKEIRRCIEDMNRSGLNVTWDGIKNS